MFTLQLAPGASTPTGQLPEPLKPLLNTNAEVIDRFALPVFLSVSACAGLAEPTSTLPKLRELAERLSIGFGVAVGDGEGDGFGLGDGDGETDGDGDGVGDGLEPPYS